MKTVIKRPLITEKNAVQNVTGVYVFEVDTAATKPEIKDAVEKNFQVKVASVRTVNARGAAKANKFGRGRVSYWKKAFVQLQTGQKIGLFEGA